MIAPDLRCSRCGQQSLDVGPTTGTFQWTCNCGQKNFVDRERVHPAPDPRGISPADMNCYFCMEGQVRIQAITKMGDRVQSKFIIRFDICHRCASLNVPLSPIAREISNHVAEHVQILEAEIKRQFKKGKK